MNPRVGTTLTFLLKNRHRPSFQNIVLNICTFKGWMMNKLQNLSNGSKFKLYTLKLTVTSGTKQQFKEPNNSGNICFIFQYCKG